LFANPFSELNRRLDAVTELMKASALSELFGFMRGLHDLERGICRIYYKKCTINEFVVTISTFDKYESGWI
jgi:DNA mismatch repair protein MSH3